MITHEEASELLASFALDAVESHEFEEIEEHLAGCPRCRAELDAHREVAAALGNSVEPLPEGLWESIASRLPERRDVEPPPMPRLVPGERGRAGIAGGGGAQRGRSRPTRLVHSARVRATTLATLAVAAAAVAAVLGVSLVRADNQITREQAAIEQSGPTAVAAALVTPGHRVIDLDGAHNRLLAEFVTVPSGQGYLVKSNLPALSSAHTYQLWGAVHGRSVSLGLLGQSPYDVAFTMAGSTRPTALAITVEPTGGSVTPTAPIVASGTV